MQLPLVQACGTCQLSGKLHCQPGDICRCFRQELFEFGGDPLQTFAELRALLTNGGAKFGGVFLPSGSEMLEQHDGAFIFSLRPDRGCEVCKHVDVAYFTGSPAEAREALGIGAEHIAEPIGDPDLTIGPQQSPIVFRLPVQPDGIVGVVLIERGHHAGAVFPQILGSIDSHCQSTVDFEPQAPQCLPPPPEPEVVISSEPFPCTNTRGLSCPSAKTAYEQHHKN